MTNFKIKQYSEEDNQLFLNYLGELNGFLNKCKNLHWAAPKKNIHTYLDDFHEILGDYQDSIAEGYMGILGQMGPSDVETKESNSEDARSFLEEVINSTKNFYNNIPEGVIFKGICGEVESFIQNCNKYKYLFSLSSNEF